MFETRSLLLKSQINRNINRKVFVFSILCFFSPFDNQSWKNVFDVRQCLFMKVLIKVSDNNTYKFISLDKFNTKYSLNLHEDKKIHAVLEYNKRGN